MIVAVPTTVDENEVQVKAPVVVRIEVTVVAVWLRTDGIVAIERTMMQLNMIVVNRKTLKKA